MTKELAKQIVLAQASSDVGKGIYELYSRLLPRLARCALYGYAKKDTCILNALDILSRHPMKDIHFYAVKDHDRVAKYLVYFDFMLDSHKVQISFHTYNDHVKKFVTGSKKSHTKWRSDFESRKMAFLLAEKYGFLRAPSA